MKGFIAVLAIAALVNVAYADDAADVAEVKKYVDCAIKAMREGVPSIPVPKHDPTHISNFSLKNDKGLIQYDAGLTNSVLYNLMDFDFPVLNAPRVNPDRVVYNYEVYWEKLNITGTIKLLYKAFPLNIDETAADSFIIKKLRWSGKFDFTRSVNGARPKVNAFSIKSKTKAVDVDFDFFGALPVEKVVSSAIYELLNHFPGVVTEFFRNQRFNGFWLGHEERINAVLDLCGIEH